VLGRRMARMVRTASRKIIEVFVCGAGPRFTGHERRDKQPRNNKKGEEKKIKKRETMRERADKPVVLFLCLFGRSLVFRSPLFVYL